MHPPPPAGSFPHRPEGRRTVVVPSWRTDPLEWPDEHPRRIVAWLRERGEPEVARAVVAHFDPAEVPELTALDRALLACDELTGFVMACCLVRPDGIRSLSPSSTKKKFQGTFPYYHKSIGMLRSTVHRRSRSANTLTPSL
jgi:hypothetical protein